MISRNTFPCFIILIFTTFILYKDTFSNHHRYKALISLCNAHRGAALIVPECMKYIYGDEAKAKITNILKQYFMFKNLNSEVEKEEVIGTWVKKNFDSSSFAKRVSGEYFFKDSNSEVQNQFISLLEKIFIEIFSLNSHYSLNYTFKIDEIPLEKKRIFYITTRIASTNLQEEVKLVWLLERKFGKYKIIDLNIYNNNLSGFFKKIKYR